MNNLQGFKPVGSKIVVSVTSAQAKIGEIIIPQSAQKKSNIGIIEEAGPGRFVDGVFVEVLLKKGDKILYSSYAGTEIELDRKAFLIIDADDVIGKFDA